jgi:hypothetical protein
MPHGRLVLFPTIILTIAATLSMIVLCNCGFVQAVDTSSYTYSYDDRAGFWPGCVYSSSYSSSSFSFSEYQDDAARKVAMSFGLIACIVGVAAMIALWPITCRPYSKTWVYIIGGTVIFAFVSQLLTFAMFDTKFCQTFGCRIAWAGVMSIIAAILWLVGAIGVFIIPKPLETTTYQENVVTQGTINITETIQPDGTKVTESVTTCADGTKTVERTIERNVNPVVGVEQPFDGEEHEIAHAVAMKAET